MTSIATAILSAFAGIMMAYAQTGTWTGELEVQGMKLPLVLHLGVENPTMDSPNQGAKGIPMQPTMPTNDSIYIKIPAIGATLAGRMEGDKIVGTFTQSGYELPIILYPGERTIVRPQTPKPPFPYAQEEVSFTNGDAILKGTLTLPDGYSKDTPVLIMITGSGLQNRDEEIMEHKPFAVIADALARNGIATLRYDDRGYGESTGDAVNCTTEDLMRDALSGINLLREKFNRVGVLGHSEGGTIALMLGADNNVDFIVSMAGMVVSGKETLLSQNRYFLTQAGYPQPVVDDYCRLLTLAFDNDKSLIQELGSSDVPNELKQNIMMAISQLHSRYMRYFLGLDIRGRLGDVKCPVLALNGAKDTQVFYEDNLNALRIGLPNNAQNQISAMEGLNHLLQHCTTGSVNEYGEIEETISPDALEAIVTWVKSLPQ